MKPRLFLELKIVDCINTFFVVSIAIFEFSLLCSCKQSKNDEILSNADNAAAAARHAVTNGIDLTTNSQRLTQANEVAAGVKMALTNQVALETFVALEALKHLHESGRLPNDSKDEHGQVTSEMVDSVVSNESLAITYPVSRTFHLVKDGETSTNNYILVKQAKDSEWKLQKAWLTDSKGQVILEWPVR